VKKAEKNKQTRLDTDEHFFVQTQKNVVKEDVAALRNFEERRNSFVYARSDQQIWQKNFLTAKAKISPSFLSLSRPA
jgi:hypothetical protein